MNISQIEKVNCSGCGLCSATCRKGAITLEKDDFFLYPKVDHSVCVNCSVCYSKCPYVSFRRDENSFTKRCYAAWADDPMHVENSSSGGIFFELATKMTEIGGVVCGAVYDNDFKGCHHILSDRAEDIERMRGSKYVQSKTAEIYNEIKKTLDNGVPVLFTGTPCQTAAVLNYVGDNSLLVCATLICHGPTSDDLLEKYVSGLEKKKNSRTVYLNMRRKMGKWLPMYIEVGFENGEKSIEPLHLTGFGKIFQSNYLMRESCYNCGYKGYPLIGDIILGDFKGIEETGLEYNRMGTSCVIINTEKGNEMFEKIGMTVKKMETDLSIIEKKNARLMTPVKEVDRGRREEFTEIFQKEDLSKAADFAVPKRSMFKKIISRLKKLSKK